MQELEHKQPYSLIFTLCPLHTSTNSAADNPLRSKDKDEIAPWNSITSHSTDLQDYTFNLKVPNGMGALSPSITNTHIIE